MTTSLIAASVDLVLNLTLLVALSTLSGFIEKRVSKTSLAGSLLQGALFGISAVIGMTRPLTLGPGLIFDGRSVMICLCAMYFGPVSAGVAVASTAACRILLGGSGAVMGVLVILSSAGIGLAARSRLKPDETPPTPFQLYLFGLLVHLVMLGLTFTLPGSSGFSVLRRIGAAIIVLYPLATVLSGKILSDQIAARKAFEALRKSEERFKLSMDASNDGLWDWDLTTDAAYFNPAYYRILGYEPGDFPAEGKTWEARVHPDDLERTLAANRECIEGGKAFLETEFRMKTKNGDWRWIYSRGKCISRDGRGIATRLVGTHVDITERKKNEERLLAALKEKEVLLREVHHRVKNNLSIVSSLLSLQSSGIRTPEDALAAFQNSRERILAMSLVHEELYKSADYTRIDMSEYVGKLLAQLTLAYNCEESIRLICDIRNVVLDVSTSIPCGLILNELITNAFKYAFPDERSGSIHISMEESEKDEIELLVSDDGVGMPAETAENERESLGLTLVQLLVKQLRGTMEIDTSRGTRFHIRFPKDSDS